MRNRGRSERSNGRKGRVKSTHISTRIYSLLEKDTFFWTRKNLPLYEISIRQCAISASNTSGKHAAQSAKRETDARNIERAGGVRRETPAGAEVEWAPEREKREEKGEGRNSV